MAHLDEDVTGDVSGRVAIIGGGYAGIAAAVSLAERGIRTTLFEAGNVLGGRARRVAYRGETIDNGQHILSGAYSELLRMMALVGVPDTAILRIPLTLVMPPEFSLQAPQWVAPFHLVWALLSAKGLALADRLAAIRFMQTLKRLKFQISAADTVATLLAAHSQPEKLVRYLWQPLTISALNTPIAKASAQVFANVLRDALASGREASDLILPRTDLSALFPDVAANWLAARGGVVNRGLRVNSATVTQHIFQLVSSVGKDSFGAVIVAVGPHQLDAISLPTACTPVVPFIYEPIVTIYLKFNQRVRLQMPMLGQVEGIVQWFFDRRQLGTNEGARDEGDGLIAAIVSASGPHESLSHEELAEQALRELERHTGPLPVPAWQKVISEKFATFSCTSPIQARRPSCVTPTPGLFLAGDYTAGPYPATLEAAVRSGKCAADHVVTHLSRPRT